MRLIDCPPRLALDLPPEIRETEWDVILIDGPAGYEDNSPGRMKSIYESSRLIRQGGSIFVHDQEREVERAYGNRYLLQTNVVAEAKGTRHFTSLQISARDGVRVGSVISNEARPAAVAVNLQIAGVGSSPSGGTGRPARPRLRRSR